MCQNWTFNTPYRTWRKKTLQNNCSLLCHETSSAGIFYQMKIPTSYFIKTEMHVSTGKASKSQKNVRKYRKYSEQFLEKWGWVCILGCLIPPFLFYFNSASISSGYLWYKVHWESIFSQKYFFQVPSKGV